MLLIYQVIWRLDCYDFGFIYGSFCQEKIPDLENFIFQVGKSKVHGKLTKTWKVRDFQNWGYGNVLKYWDS